MKLILIYLCRTAAIRTHAIIHKLTLVVIRSRKISTNALHEMRPDGAASINYNEIEMIFVKN